MKKLFLAVLVVGFSLASATTAKADYAVRFSYGNKGRSSYYHPRRQQARLKPAPCHHPARYACRYRKRCHPLVASRTTVTRTYRTRPREEILHWREKLGISDIIVLSKAGVRDDILIEKIAKTGAVFDLSVEEIQTLQKEGVSNRVINCMLNTKR